MVKSDDTEVIESVRYVALERINGWIGLPIDVSRIARRVRNVPQEIRREGAFSWLVGAAISLWLLYTFAPLREVLVQFELMLAMFYINFWLMFLPFILIGAGLHVLGTVYSFLRKPCIEFAQTASKATLRFGLLGATFFIDHFYGDLIRAFIAS